MNEDYGYKYRITSGEFFYNSLLLDTGYSGYPPYKNIPSAVHLMGLGPIPYGDWSFGFTSHNETHMGPIAIPILPSVGTNTYGRGGFYAHGESISNPGFASHGCIILKRETREHIINNIDKRLQVIP